MSGTDVRVIYGHGGSPLASSGEGIRNMPHFMGIEDWRGFMKTAEYEGMQVTPYRGSRLLHDIKTQHAAGDFENVGGLPGTPLIHSLHQTWREDSVGSMVTDIIRHPEQNPPTRILRRLGVLALMQQNMASVDRLAAIQNMVSPHRLLPAVLYPTIDNGYVSYVGQPFGERLFQPCDEVWDKWDIHSIDDVQQKMEERGFTGIALNLAVLRCNYGVESQLGDWQELIPQLASRGLIRAVHVSLGRTDLASRDREFAQKSVQEASAFAGGDYTVVKNTEIAPMLDLTRQCIRLDKRNALPLPIVVDMPSKGRAYTHAQIVENIREIAA